MYSVQLSKLIDKMKLEILTPEEDTKGIYITNTDVNRPALQLTGYFEDRKSVV